MPTRTVIVTGPARSGKTWRLLGEYRRAFAERPPLAEHPPLDDPQVLWIAPTERAASEIRRQILSGASPALLNPGVTTFSKLAFQILAKGRPELRPLAGPAQRDLVRRLVRDSAKAGKLRNFAQAARRSSFATLLLEHFGELQRHAARAADYAKAPRRDRSIHAELAALYADYESRLEQGRLVDSSGAPLAAAELLVERPEASPGEFDLIVVDGFADLSGAELFLIEQLAARARRLRVSLTIDSRGRDDLFDLPARTLAALRRVFPRLTVEELLPRRAPRAALDHLSTHLFRNPREIPTFLETSHSPDATAGSSSGFRHAEPAQQKLEQPIEVETSSVTESRPRATEPVIEIIGAAGAHDEIVQVARRVKERLLDGARPGDIVLVFRTISDAAPRVREVFNDFGIPYALGSSTPLLRAPVVRALLGLLRLDAEDWPFRRVVRTLTNNLLHAFDGPQRARSEWLVRELQVASGRSTLLAQVSELAEKADEITAHNAGGATLSPRQARRLEGAKSARETLSLLAEALDGLPDSAPLGEWPAAFAALGRRLGISLFTRPTTAEEPSPATSSPAEERRYLASRIDEIAWTELVRHLESIARLEPAPVAAPRFVTRAEVITIVADLAQNENLPAPHDEAGRVRVLSAQAARNVPMKHLFLGALSEQAFPAPERSTALAAPGDYRFHGAVARQPESASQVDTSAESAATSRAHEEMLLFYELVSQATDTLTLSYPALDAKAQRVPPSPYVTEVERTLGDAPIRRTGPRLSPVAAGSAPYSPGEWRIQAVAQALEGNYAPLGAFVGAGDAAAAPIEAALHTIHERSRRERFGIYEGMLRSPGARKKLAERFGKRHTWSPSQWETYASCPFQFFLSSVLKLEPLGELALETDHARRGSRLHNVMAAFHRSFREEFSAAGSILRLDREWLLEQFQQIVAAAITLGDGIEGALAELDRRQIEKWGRHYLAQFEEYERKWATADAPLVPTHFELRFGPPHHRDEDEDPRSVDDALTLVIADEEIRITGRIDRVDVGRVGDKVVFNIVDYKSGGRPSINNEKIESGERLQPVLYAMAAHALIFGEESSTPYWSGYWSMKNGVELKGGYALKFSDDGQTLTDQWHTLKDTVIERIEHFVRAIRHGDFPVHSLDDHCTGRCEFHTVCRVAQVRSLEKVRPTTCED